VKALFVVLSIAVMVSGIILYCPGFFPGSSSRPIKNPAVSRENYAKIKRGMELWEVTSILGPGEVAQLVPRRLERVFKHEHGVATADEKGNRHLSEDDAKKLGKKIGELAPFFLPEERKIVWRSGDKAIYVTFHDDKVIERMEANLFRE
jgi:hypothetical protein